MVFKLVERVYERVTYEVDRARRLVPTVVRFGVSQARDRLVVSSRKLDALCNELLHHIDHWRGVCDHTATRGKAVKKTVKKAPKRPKSKPSKNS